MNDNPIPSPGSNGGCQGGRLLVVCDFDGTVCRVDMGNAFLERFAEGWEEIDRSYSAGKVGSRVAYSRIAPLFRANRPQVLDFVLRRERLDPFFPEFLSFCRGRKIDIKIVSDGLDVYIEAILQKHGLDVEFFSNRLVFQGNDRIDFAFPLVNEECGRCGTCKRSLLDRFRPGYDRIIYIGDGYSDVCPARAADQVFAKEILYEKCVNNGTPCLRYDDFADIRRCLEKILSDGFSKPVKEEGFVKSKFPPPLARGD
jgi:2-hydroxy-3-keto-5-methylthiopentenyl-1-phosphate phosphatase